jgi:SNF2 family DNA or RNA helicase
MLNHGAALLMDMGTMKTKTVIDTAEIMHSLGLIRNTLVITVLEITDTWGGDGGQLEQHSSRSAWAIATGSKSKRLKAIEEVKWGSLHDSTTLCWLIINVDGVKTVEKEICDLRPDLVIIDESTVIKSRQADRTKLILESFSNARYKIIMTGNIMPKGAHEVFSQYKFVDEGVFGSKFSRFQEDHLEVDYFGAFIRLKDPERFHKTLHSIAYRVTKDECLSLPPKVYERVVVEMTSEQKKAYKEMEEEAMASYDDLNCAAPFVITKFLRCSQIAGGFFPGVKADEDGAGEMTARPITPNPKIEVLIDMIQRLPANEQIVIWARFRMEIAAIHARLQKEGISSVTFYGGVSRNARIEARHTFSSREARVFIGNASSGGKGLNDLVGAGYVFYYSNDYSAENRQQSEDRNHRPGIRTDRSVTYIDLITKGTIDEEVVDVLKSNKDFSDALLSRTLQLKQEEE